jgi:hypothetical protein
MTKTIEVGSKVAYSVHFLRSIGMSHGMMAHARGVVKERVAHTSTLVLLEIDWNTPGLPAKVNECNIAKVGGRGFAAI